MKPESDELAFAWAVREQEYCWLLHDHAYVEAAEAGWTDDALLRDMLRRYGLLRGIGATLLAGDGTKGSTDNTPNRATFLRLARKQSEKLVDGAADENSAIWQDFGYQLATAYRQIMQEGDWFMPSATAKIMWCHRPDIAPMFDKYAARSAKKGARGLEMPRNFFMRCYQLLGDYRGAIDKAKELWGSNYPYDIRILDKFLWVRGNNSGHKILERFKAGCGALGDEKHNEKTPA